MTTAVDASVLIAYFDANDTHHDAAVNVLAEAVRDDLVASAMTIAELLVVPARVGDDALRMAQEAFTRLEIGDEPFPEDAAVRLVRLRADSGLKMPDCCVLLAAETAGAETVATFDARLAKAARERGLEVAGIQA
ncbi:type II toxin-antitoxin system VapC family toxin [[Mycobacterium] vasticus]|uniref:Ribonuclease VapC n=1 Tax=[Mycobacterium] vasticus TaxID=2875777 RepID=A0ABU5YZ96_9MYCO|nr:type II toxin-antitoxin system VapC family toxin [Mycolicibacter sp. MYC017]MEB3070472.1 type II toxin-antitoxin system VapC family toxin [Mycolicibacter sp. MYC017]